MIMHAAFLSENLSLNEKPILVKNSLAFARSWTGKLTKHGHRGPPFWRSG